MKRIVLLAAACACAAAAPKPWQQLTYPTAAEVAAGFKSPPPEYGATVTWGWNGPMTEEVITRDLDAIHARGLRVATIEAGYRMDNAPYLSDGWFKLIRFAAEEAQKRGMRLWIIDEGKYPSGFAGGKFTTDRPDLRMQGIAVAERIPVAAGATVTRSFAPEVLGIIAVNTATGESRSLEISRGKLSWIAPAGTWELLVVDHQFRTGVTRAVNDPTQAKTDKNSMGDLLNPVAVRQWMEWTHERYKRHLGPLLGTAVLGFRGDEPDFAYPPWTGGFAELFQARKGYDVRPWLAYCASFGRNQAAPTLTDEQRRAKADYWDVWSELFAQHFFKAQADWCAANGVEYMTHLNQDHDLAMNIRLSGDFFRDLRAVQVPGIDVIWSQIYPGRGPADFPKFASSVAHVYGHPRVLSESFAAFNDPVTLDVARWVVNQQLVRGVSLFEFMFLMSSANRDAPPATAPAAPQTQPGIAGAVARVQNRGRRYLDEPEFAALAAYTNRCQYLLAQGRPAASIAVYAPIMSFWLGDQEANPSMLRIAQQLLEAQRDFDFVDEFALASDMKLAGGEFTNRSGQTYRAVIVPSVVAISRAALARLRDFAMGGGKVFFVGRTPTLVVGESILRAGGATDWSWAGREPAGQVTAAMLAALPAPDIALDTPCAPLKINHRRLRDADVYFAFNENDQPQSRTVTLAGGSGVEIWNPQSGETQPLAAAVTVGDTVRVPLALGAGEARIIVVRRAR